MSELEVLKEQVKALEKLVELKERVINELQKSQYTNVPYYPSYPLYPRGTWITTSSNGNSINITTQNDLIKSFNEAAASVGATDCSYNTLKITNGI